MKIFEVHIGGEKDYVVADSLFEAIKFYLEDTGNHFVDLDDVVELDKENYHKYTVVYDEGDEMTFAKAIEDNERMPPYILASTAY